MKADSKNSTKRLIEISRYDMGHAAANGIVIRCGARYWARPYFMLPAPLAQWLGHRRGIRIDLFPFLRFPSPQGNPAARQDCNESGGHQKVVAGATPSPTSHVQSKTTPNDGFAECSTPQLQHQGLSQGAQVCEHQGHDCHTAIAAARNLNDAPTTAESPQHSANP